MIVSFWLPVLTWYLLISLAGWLAFPLAYRLLRFLPDRGVTLLRPLGLLLWGYAFWLLCSLRVLQNDAGGVLFGLLVLAGLSAWALMRTGWAEMRGWLGDHRGVIVTGEVIFLAGFLLWALVRALDPAAAGTEKPMELAFINAILRSPTFPPADPWLSGYAISYYYFGYVMVAMLAKLAGLTGGVAFNLAIASWFGLTAITAYGLLYNLLALRDPARAWLQSAWAPLASLFILLVSNLEGFLEMLHARGVFWSQGADGTLQSGFWKWINIQELVNPPVQPFQWEPQRMGGVWWWRASRVLQDFDFQGGSREIIDEFPMFSYILGDLHPHVLAMPFALLAAAIALNVYLRLRCARDEGSWLPVWSDQGTFWLSALALGGLAFLNTWDFPIYLALLAAAVVLARYLNHGFSVDRAVEFFATAMAVGFAGIILYLPFYFGFASQAAGFLPSLVFFTRGVYLWVMFAPLLLPLFAWLIWQYVQVRHDAAPMREFLLAITLIAGLWVLWSVVAPSLTATIALLLALMLIIVVALLLWLRVWRRLDAGMKRGLMFAGAVIAGLWLLSLTYGVLRLRVEPGLSGIYGAGPADPLMVQSIVRRFDQPGTWLTLLVLLALTWGLFRAFRRPDPDAVSLSEMVAGSEVPVTGNAVAPGDRRSNPFVLLLVLVGIGLVLVPEFIYLRDQFGWRMNTIFKFYFQAWILWGIAAAYAFAVLWQEMSWRVAGAIVRVTGVLLIAAALVYPVFNLAARFQGLTTRELTLDGSRYLGEGELEAIRWLQNAPRGVVAEAIGGSYTGYARVSTHSGMPTVLGWPGHESQWRGGAEEMGTRQPDIIELYRARSWESAQQVIAKYNIRYIYVGPLERGEYRPDEFLFEQYLKPVFRNDLVTIYEVSRSDTLGQPFQP